jgi:WXG100 family type VII secretion target
MREDAYSLDADDLAATVDDLARAHAALHELAIDLERRIGELHLTWEGQAAEAHRLAHAVWDQDFAEMRDALDRMRHAADTAHRNYTSAATANRQLWESVR